MRKLILSLAFMMAFVGVLKAQEESVNTDVIQGVYYATSSNSDDAYTIMINEKGFGMFLLEKRGGGVIGQEDILAEKSEGGILIYWNGMKALMRQHNNTNLFEIEDSIYEKLSVDVGKGINEIIKRREAYVNYINNN